MFDPDPFTWQVKINIIHFLIHHSRHSRHYLFAFVETYAYYTYYIWWWWLWWWLNDWFVILESDYFLTYTSPIVHFIKPYRDPCVFVYWISVRFYEMDYTSSLLITGQYISIPCVSPFSCLRCGFRYQANQNPFFNLYFTVKSYYK